MAAVTVLNNDAMIERGWDHGPDGGKRSDAGQCLIPIMRLHLT